jgi:hypothetical protein
MPAKLHVVQTRLETKLYEKMLAEAQRQGRSAANYVMQLIAAALAKK